MLKSTEPVSLPEQVYRSLRDAIINGVYTPGTMLRQDEVARLLGVSRNPLREALPRLESEGIVVLYPRRGYAVAELDPAAIEEVFALRILLETAQIRRALAARQPGDDHLVFNLLGQMGALAAQADAADLTAWFELNQRFHDALMLPACYPHHMRALRQSRGALEIYIRTEVRLTGDLDEAQREHALMAEAYQRGRVDVLVDLVRAHSEHTRDRLLQRLANNSRAIDTLKGSNLAVSNL